MPWYHRTHMAIFIMPTRHVWRWRGPRFPRHRWLPTLINKCNYEQDVDVHLPQTKHQHLHKKTHETKQKQNKNKNIGCGIHVSNRSELWDASNRTPRVAFIHTFEWRTWVSRLMWHQKFATQDLQPHPCLFIEPCVLVQEQTPPFMLMWTMASTNMILSVW